MEALLVGIGAVLAVWGLLQARRSGDNRRQQRGRYRFAADGRLAAGLERTHDLRTQAMSILQEPVNFTADWEGLTGAAPFKQFRLGAVFGIGTGLLLAGLVSFVAAPLWSSLPGAAVRPSPSAAFSQGSETKSPAMADAGLPPAPGDAAPAAGGGPVAPPESATPAQPASPSPAQAATPAPVPSPGPTPVATASAPTKVNFTINPGEAAGAVAAGLRQAGLIADSRTFLSRLEERKLDVRLQAGRFNLHTDMDIDQVINVLTGLS